MSLPRVSSSSTQASTFSCFGEPLVVRMFGEEILEIFLDKTAFLFGILSNPEEGVLRKRVTFLPLQPVLPEQIRALQKLLSPEMSCLRLRHLNVIQIEPKLLGGGTRTSIDPEVQTAQELFLTLSELTKENIAGIDQREVFDKINTLSKALPSLSTYKNRLADAWCVAKVLHMAVDVLLLTIWDKEKEDDQDTRYSFEQKKAILKPIRNAKKILDRHAFLMKEATLLSLDLTETGVQLLPELDMKSKDWKVFVHIGEAVNGSFTATESIERNSSQHVSKLLAELWLSLGGYWTVSPNLYGDSILARSLLLNETFQVSELLNLLKCSSVEETFSSKESEENSDSISRHLLAFDRLTNLSLYKPSEDLTEQAFHEICRWTNSKNETLRKSAILSLTQISLLSQDPLIKGEALQLLDELSLNQEENSFLFSYQNWVTDNLPRGYLSEENLKVEQAFQKEMARGSFDFIKLLSFCAADQSIPPLFVENGFDPLGSTLKRLVDLGLVQENSGTYKISKRTQNRFKKLISERDESDGMTLLSLSRYLNKMWNFDETHSEASIDQQGNIPLHVQSFVENILKGSLTSDSLVIASIALLNKLGFYHLFVKKDLQKALDSFRKVLDRFDLLSSELDEEVPPDLVLPRKQDVEFLFKTCCSLDQNKFKVDLLVQELDFSNAPFLSALIKTFSNISSLKINSLNSKSIEAVFLMTKGSKILNLDLQSIGITIEGCKALAATLPASQLTNLRLSYNKISRAGVKALAAALPLSQLTNLVLQGKQLGAEGITYFAASFVHMQHPNMHEINAKEAKALAAVLPISKLTNLDLGCNKIGDEGATALAAALPSSKLTNLDLEDNEVGAKGAKALAAALPTSQVTNLNLYHNSIGDEGAKALARVLPTSQLTHLYLNFNCIGDEGAKALAAGLRTSKLTCLDLWHNRIGDEGAKALGASLRVSQLTCLDLNFNCIGDEGAKALVAGLRTSKLDKLDLGQNLIRDEGAKALAAGLWASQLTRLDLYLNSIGDEGAKALAAALPTSKLDNLDLQGNSIGDEGAKALVASFPTSKLTSLNLQCNKIGDEVYKALAAALPTPQPTGMALYNKAIGAERQKALLLGISFDDV